MVTAATLPARSDEKPSTLRDQIAKMRPEFAKALPGHITPERFVRTAQTAIALTRNINKVRNPQSLLAACTKAAADGLILDGREAALVVDYNGDVQYRPMMRGLLKLAYNSGEIKSIVVEVVRENDTFRHTPSDLDNPIYHEIDHTVDRGKPVLVYALAELRDGGIIPEVMPVAEINRIRDRSDAYKAFKAGKIKSTPWDTDWSEMARKTVFRRLSKYLPSSTDRSAFRQAVERIDEDYSFEDGTDDNTEAPRPSGKKRGAAAEAMKNVTPPRGRSRQKPKPEPEANHYESDDPVTGEIIEHDDNGPGPEDDI